MWSLFWPFWVPLRHLDPLLLQHAVAVGGSSMCYNKRDKSVDKNRASSWFATPDLH